MTTVTYMLVLTLACSILVVGLGSEQSSAIRGLGVSVPHATAHLVADSEISTASPITDSDVIESADYTTSESALNSDVTNSQKRTNVSSDVSSLDIPSATVISDTTRTVTTTPADISSSRNDNFQSTSKTKQHPPAVAAELDSDYPSQVSQLSESERQEVLKALESTFLSLVGLSARPKPNKSLTVPQYMLDLYRQHVHSHERGSGARSRIGQRGLHNANTIRSYVFQENSGQDKHPEDVVRVKFNMTSHSAGREEELQAAELRLFRQGAHNRTGERAARHRIEVYQVLQPASPAGDPITRLLDSRVIDPAETRWEAFDVTPAFGTWSRKQSSNHGLEVRVSSLSRDGPPVRDHVRLRRSTRAAEADWEAEKPLLVSYSQDPQADGRSKRSAGRKDKNHRKKRSKNKDRRRKRKGEDRPHKERNHKKNCRRRTLYVDFRDVGWTDWIVAPPGYDAFYCFGECPFHLGDNLNTTNHAVVQQFVHSVDSQAVPKPCCVPTKLREVALLYIDEENKVVLRKYEEMVVEACGCR